MTQKESLQSQFGGFFETDDYPFGESREIVVENGVLWITAEKYIHDFRGHAYTGKYRYDKLFSYSLETGNIVTTVLFKQDPLYNSYLRGIGTAVKSNKINDPLLSWKEEGEYNGTVISGFVTWKIIAPLYNPR